MLEGQTNVGEQRRERLGEPRDRMPIGGGTEILGRDVQIELGARDLTMPEQIAQGDEADAGAHEMCRKGVTDAMRRHPHREARAARQGAHALVTAPRESRRRKRLTKKGAPGAALPRARR